MHFQFSSLQDFLVMGGHGLYVWMAYGTVAAVVIYLAVSVSWREKQLLRQIKRMQQRIDAHQSHIENESVE